MQQSQTNKKKSLIVYLSIHIDSFNVILAIFSLKFKVQRQRQALNMLPTALPFSLSSTFAVFSTSPLTQSNQVIIIVKEYNVIGLHQLKRFIIPCVCLYPQ
mgnify:CR=1 FL=1